MQLVSAHALRLLQLGGIPTLPDDADFHPLCSLILTFDPTTAMMRAEAYTHDSTRSAHCMIDPLIGMHAYQARALASGIHLDYALWSQFINLSVTLYRAHTDYDATFTECSFGLIYSGMIAVTHAIIHIDENALFRQPELSDFERAAVSSMEARQIGDRVYSGLFGGTIACITNGAGLLMASLDGLAEHGLSVCCTVEIDAEPTLDRLSLALRHAQAQGAIGIFTALFCSRISPAQLAERVIALAPPSAFSIYLNGEDAASARQRLHEAHILTDATLSGAIARLQAALDGEETA
jgi:succinyl-CoA synthetase beta subunit